MATETLQLTISYHILLIVCNALRVSLAYRLPKVNNVIMLHARLMRNIKLNNSAKFKASENILLLQNSALLLSYVSDLRTEDS